MYEFDEEGWFDEEWDQNCADQGEPLTNGWLIQLTEKPIHSRDLRGRDRSIKNCLEPQFLQIATGQWCSAQYATLFPVSSAAEVYAEEFGYVVGYHVELVKHRF